MTIGRIIPIALSTIFSVEQIFSAGEGKKKKEAYIEALILALQTAEIVTNRDLLDDAKFKSLVGQLADIVIDIDNYVQERRKKS